MVGSDRTGKEMEVSITSTNDEDLDTENVDNCTVKQKGEYFETPVYKDKVQALENAKQPNQADKADSNETSLCGLQEKVKGRKFKTLKVSLRRINQEDAIAPKPGRSIVKKTAPSAELNPQNRIAKISNNMKQAQSERLKMSSKRRPVKRKAIDKPSVRSEDSGDSDQSSAGIFGESDELSSKAPDHISNKTYDCFRCGLQFPTTFYHNRHVSSKQCVIKEHYDDAPVGAFVCLSCGVQFSRADYLDVHNVLHTETAPVDFDVEFQDLQEQIADIERSCSIPVACNECQTVVENKRDMLYHSIITHGMKFVCKICGETLKCKKSLSRHRRIHHESGSPETGATYLCHECDGEFKTEKEYTIHTLKKHAVCKFKCSVCSKTYLSERFLARHKKEVHTAGAISPGSTTGSFESSNDTKKARIVDQAICNICGKVFKHLHLLTAHLKTHATERKYVCDICNKAFKTSDVLTKHKRIHSNTFTYCCEVCGLGCHQIGQMRKHIDMHNGIKRFSCDNCGQSFSRKSTLVIHKLNNKHYQNDDPDFINSKQCEFCERRFPEGAPSIYQRHIRTHTGEKPFVCKLCGRSFADHSNLNTHALSHSENKPFKCNGCLKGFIRKRLLMKHLENYQQCADVMKALESFKEMFAESTTS